MLKKNIFSFQKMTKEHYSLQKKFEHLTKEMDTKSLEAQTLLSGMRDDSIFQAFSTDQVALELLKLELCKGEGGKESWIKNMRYRLRLLGTYHHSKWLQY